MRHGPTRPVSLAIGILSAASGVWSGCGPATSVSGDEDDQASTGAASTGASSEDVDELPPDLPTPCELDCEPSGPNVEWETVIDGPGRGFDLAYDAASDPRGGLFVGGLQEDEQGRSALWLARLDARGSLDWEQTWDHRASHSGFGVRIDAGDRALVVLSPRDGGVGFRDLSSRDLGGLTRWTTTAPPDFTYLDLALVASGDTMVVGISTARERTNMVMARYDDRGSVAWTKEYDLEVFPARLAALADGDAMVAGFETRADGVQRAWVGRFDSAGALRWETTDASSADFAVVEALAVDSEGQALVGGSERAPSGHLEGWVASLSQAGELRWRMPIEEGHGGSVRGAGMGEDGTAWITGYSVSGSPNEAYLGRIDPQAGLHDVRRFGSPRSVEPYDLELAVNDRPIAVGRAAFNAGPDAWAAAY